MFLVTLFIAPLHLGQGQRARPRTWNCRNHVFQW